MIITTTTLTLFLCVCAATLLATGFALCVATFFVTRAINRYARATEANNESANEFIAMKRDELAAIINMQKGPRVAQMDPNAFLKGLRPAPTGDDNKGPKGSA